MIMLWPRAVRDAGVGWGRNGFWMYVHILTCSGIEFVGVGWKGTSYGTTIGS